MPAAPYLLQLPREIRDAIYPYLTQAIEFNWQWSNMRYGVIGHIVHVKVDNAPLDSVMQTHPRLCDEYRESDCFKNLEVTLQFCWEDSPLGLPIPTPGAERMAANLFRYIRHGTMLGQHCPILGQEIDNLNDFNISTQDLRDLAQALTSQAPYLSTLRVFFDCNVGKLMRVPDSDPFNTRQDIPATFGDLPLIQSVKAWRQKPGYPYPTMAAYYGHPLQEVYETHRVEAYVFGTGMTTERFWTPEDAVSMFSVEKLPMNVGETSEGKARADSVEEIKYWEEWRDEEVKELDC